MNYFPLSLYCLRGAQCNPSKPVIMKCNEMRRRVIGLKSAPVISKIHLRSHNMKEEDGGGEYLATDTISNAIVPKMSGKHICVWKFKDTSVCRGLTVQKTLSIPNISYVSAALE